MTDCERVASQVSSLILGFFADGSAKRFPQARVYSIRVNPLWTHFGATVLDKLEGAIATVLVGYGMKKVSNALALF